MENPDEYTDEEEFQDNVLDVQREQLEDALGDYPRAKKPDSLFTLFDKVFATQDSSKVSNIDKRELGDLQISVREAQRLALLGHTFHHPVFGNYFFAVGEITLATAMSKKGWLGELFVTTKKFAAKGQLGSGETPGKRTWTIFGKNKIPSENP